MENKVMKFYSKAGSNIILRQYRAILQRVTPISITMWI